MVYGNDNYAKSGHSPGEAPSTTTDVQYLFARLESKQTQGSRLNKVILKLIAIANLVILPAGEPVPDGGGLSIVFGKIR
jgi:hypothetical protein